jgi:RNA polymerase sigma factor (sigma-70 family)
MSPVLTETIEKASGVRSDTRLVADCLAGDEQSWSLLIEKYKALIYSIPIKYGLPAHEAADVFQATCVELLARLPELREPRALPKWLMQVAHHQCFRWKQQQGRLVSRDSEELPVVGTPAIADVLVQQTEEEQMLREAMALLSPQCRRLVEMLFFESPPRPYAVAAAELGVALGSIGFIRQKCIARLRRQLDKAGFE